MEIKISTSPYVIFCQKYCVAHELKIIFITQVRVHTTIYTFKIYVLPWFESQSQHYIFAKCINEYNYKEPAGAVLFIYV